MRYQIQKKDDTLVLSGLTDVDSLSDAQVFFVLPHSVKENTVVYNLDDTIPLSDCMKYISEDDFLLYIYSIAKMIEYTQNRFDARLHLALDLQFLFCKEKRVFGIFVPEDDQKKTDQKSFFWNLIFTACYQEKELPVVRELLDFIRTARTIEPQDILMFIEMGARGRAITNTYNDLYVKRSENNMADVQQSVQCENDYSSFLSEFDMPIDEEIDDSEPNAKSQEQNRPISDSIEQSNVDFLMNFDFSTESTEIPNRMDFSDVSPELLEEVQRTDPQLLCDALREILHGPAEDELEQEEVQEADFLFSSQKEAPDSDDILSDMSHETEKDALELSEDSVKEVSASYSKEFSEITPKDEPVNDAAGFSVPDEPFLEMGTTDDSFDGSQKETSSDESILHKHESSEMKPMRSSVEVSSASSEKDSNVPSISELHPASKQEQQEKIQHFTIPIDVAQGTHGFRSEKNCYVLVSSDGQRIPINKPVFLVGRLTQGVDLTVSDVFVSRTHAQLVQNENGVSLLDLHPKNPTFLNEKAIEPGKAYPLYDSDRIRFGKNTYYFRCEKERG